MWSIKKKRKKLPYGSGSMSNRFLILNLCEVGNLSYRSEYMLNKFSILMMWSIQEKWRNLYIYWSGFYVE